MTEPQVWTLIGVFAATMIGVITFLSQSVTRSISALGTDLGNRIDSLRRETNARFETVHVEMNARFETMQVEMNSVRDDIKATEVSLEKVHEEIAHLNRDIQAIARHVHPD